MRDTIVFGPGAYRLCREIKPEELEREQVFERLDTKLKEFRTGIGLAAPQIGLPVQAFIIRLPGNPGPKERWWDGWDPCEMDIWNPVVVEATGAQTFLDECLSYKGKTASAVAPLDIVFKNGDGKQYVIHGFPAAVFTHEMNHLIGKNRWLDAGRNDPCPCGSGKKFKRCCQ